jgi:hypothetical protein
MHERVSLVLSTGRVSLSAGDAPVTVDVVLTNRSQVVDQFDLQIVGGQPDWYSITPDRVSLFPGESTTSRLSLSPPRREDVLAGQYEIEVRATSRDDAGLASIAGLVLTIVPSGGFEIRLPKSRDEGRAGSYRLQVANLSDAPLSLLLAPNDPETALTFFFPAVQMQLAAYERRDIDFNLQPNRRRLKGEPRVYPFTIEATPQLTDRARSARDTQRTQGEFIYRPRFQRWPWQGLPALVNVLVPAVATVAALSAVLVASGAVGGRNTPPTPAPPDIGATLTARDVAASATASVAAAAASTGTATAAKSVTPTPTMTGTPTPTPTRTSTPAATSPTPTPTIRIIIGTLVALPTQPAVSP